MSFNQLWFTDNKHERKLLFQFLKYLQSSEIIDFNVQVLTIPEIEEFTPNNIFSNSQTLICDIREIVKYLRENDYNVIIYIVYL